MASLRRKRERCHLCALDAFSIIYYLHSLWSFSLGPLILSAWSKSLPSVDVEGSPCV